MNRYNTSRVAGFLLLLCLSCNAIEPGKHPSALKDEETREGPASESRMKTYEFDETARLIISTKLLGALMYKPGQQVVLTGDLKCSHGIGYFDNPERISKCSIKIGDQGTSLENLDAKMVAARLNKAFPAQTPFDQESYRELELDFKFASDGKPRDERVFASLKPERNVLLSCESDGSPRWAMSLKFNDEVKSAAVASFQREGSNPSIPSELSSLPSLNVNKQQVEGLTLLKIEAAWSQASLTIQQKKERTTFETFSNFSGKIQIGNEERNVFCSISKND